MSINTRTEDQELDRLMSFAPVLMAVMAVMVAGAAAAVVLFIGELTATDQALSLIVAGAAALIAGPAFLLAVKKFS